MEGRAVFYVLYVTIWKIRHDLNVALTSQALKDISAQKTSVWAPLILAFHINLLDPLVMAMS